MMPAANPKVAEFAIRFIPTVSHHRRKKGLSADSAIPATFFFFSSRRRHTSYCRDWSSDVCSSDLNEVVGEWSCAYTPRGGGHRRIFRGTEWYVIASGRIAEVRAYYQYHPDRDCELGEFAYRERGYLCR